MLNTPNENVIKKKIENINSNKITLITYRIPENPLFKPAEEIFLHHVMDKLGMTYDIIEYEGLEVNNFFGKLPVIYYNGKIIIQKNIFNFIKDFVFHNQYNTNISNSNSSSLTQFKEFENYINLLLFTLKEGLSQANDYYYYLKMKEKIEKSKNKKLFSSIRTYLFSRREYENINNYYLNTFPQIGDLNNIYLPIESKLYEVIKDSFSRIHFLMGKEFADRNQNLFIKLLIFSFLKEDKVLFTKVKRPVIENLKYDEDKMLSNIGAYFKSVEDGVVKNTDIKFIIHGVSGIVQSAGTKNYETSQSLTEKLTQEQIKKYSISFNPKPVKKVEDIQEFQARTNFYHQIFSVGIFGAFALIIFYMTMRKNKNQI
jgi:hypothetical protein